MHLYSSSRIGEFCTADKGNTEARATHAAYYTAAADKRGIPCFWWDDGGLLLRKALSWNFPEIVDAMVDSTSVHLKHVKIEGLDEHYHTGQAIRPELTLYWLPEGQEAIMAPTVTVSGADAVSGADVSRTDVIPLNAVVLTEGVDYEIICFDNVELGTAEVLITGLGRYSGVRTEGFQIIEKPREVDFLSVLSEDNPQLPFMIMISIPILCLLGFMAAWKAVKRGERDRIRATVGAAMSEEMEKRRQQGDYGYGDSALYRSEDSYSRNADLDDYIRNGEYDDLGDLDSLDGFYDDDDLGDL